jgi:hypothetical protein
MPTFDKFLAIVSPSLLKFLHKYCVLSEHCVGQFNTNCVNCIYIFLLYKYTVSIVHSVA